VEIIEVDISELKPAEYNPRKASAKEFADLKKSIEKFGFVVPVLVNSAPARKNIIIGGHFRVKVARSFTKTFRAWTKNGN
jgi:ParB-like chromosome segregation protein Spo0J